MVCGGRGGVTQPEMDMGMTRAGLGMMAVVLMTACSGAEGDDAEARMLARADSLELGTDYSPPPGDPLHHHTSGFAKILCSAVFLTGLDPADGATNVGGFTSPFDERAHVVDTVVDYDRRKSVV